MPASAERPGPALRAVQYLRLSKGSQWYSLDDRAAAIAIYSAARGASRLSAPIAPTKSALLVIDPHARRWVRFKVSGA